MRGVPVGAGDRGACSRHKPCLANATHTDLAHCSVQQVYLLAPILVRPGWQAEAQASFVP